ncbi:MAG: SAM-dependent methyltransferase, partial [Pirellulaceae bacterium]
MTDSAAIDSESVSPADHQFIFVACQPASQQICKKEIAARLPELALAFSRPGFLTWKPATPLPPRFNLALTFGRTFGWSEGGFAAGTIEDAAGHLAAWLADNKQIQHVHIWHRAWTSDPKRLDQDAQSDVDALSEAAGHIGDDPLPVNQMTEPDAHVLDVIRIDNGQWWLGNHVAGATAQRWPGGIPLLRTPQRLISRAWLKTAEAIAWSGITISRDEVCAEIGSAPGGSCQRLLELGAKQVLAIDPAD